MPRHRAGRRAVGAMTLTHVVVLKWKEGVRTSDVRPGCEALAALPEQLAYIKSYRIGGDIKLAGSPQNGDFTIIAEFENPEDYELYAASAEHLAAVALLLPHLAGRTAVQTYAVEYSVFAQARRVLADNALRFQFFSACVGALLAAAAMRRRR